MTHHAVLRLLVDGSRYTLKSAAIVCAQLTRRGWVWRALVAAMTRVSVIKAGRL